MIKIKDKMIEKNESLIKQKDKMIEYLENQLALQNGTDEPKPIRKATATSSIIKHKRTKTVEFKDLPEDIAPVQTTKPEITDEDPLIRKKSTNISSQFNMDTKMGKMGMVREFYIRLANFCCKKNTTLYNLIHYKIYDKMFNGVELELISARHFWRMLHNVGDERIWVTNVCKHSLSAATSGNPSGDPNDFTEIFEVKPIAKILSQLGITEDVPKPTKNFNYDDLSGCGIRILNKLVREIKNDDLQVSLYILA